MEELAIAPRGEIAAGSYELGLGGYFKKDLAPRGVFTLTGSLPGFKLIDIFGEVVFQYSSDKYFITDTGGVIRKNDTPFFSATLGFSGSFDFPGLFTFSLGGQYFFNGKGYSDLTPFQTFAADLYAAGSITLSEFNYPGMHYSILNLELKAGSFTALVGSSGSGKSTVLKLLCGFYEKYTGMIGLFGINQADWNLRDLRNKIALVSQDVFLFPATIRENIYAGLLQSFFNGVVLFFITMVTMLFLQWYVAGVLIVMALLFSLFNAGFAKTIIRLSLSIQKRIRGLTAKMIDMIKGIFIIKMFPVDRIFYNAFSSKNNRVAKFTLKMVKTKALMEGSNYLIRMFNFAGIIGVGAFLVITGVTDFGTLAALVVLEGSLSQVIPQLAQFIAGLQQSRVGVIRITELLKIPRETEEKEAALLTNQKTAAEDPPDCIKQDPAHIVTIRNLEFRYPGCAPVLKGVNPGDALNF